MKTKFIEVTQPSKQNWGKFCVARWTTDERVRESSLPGAKERSVIAGRGWTLDHIWVLDLQTGEGACFLPGGLAQADLAKHKIWVCPMFEPFLMWLYRQDLSDLDALPGIVEIDAEFALAGYRRKGAPG